MSKLVKEQKPEPMTLFHRREQSGEIPPVRLPKPEIMPGKVERAAEAMAAWDNSDPFSYGRTALHIRQGYLNPDEVEKETSLRVIARKAAKAKEVDLEKRKA